MQTRIRDQNEISRGVNGKPGRQHVAGPEMQKNGNQRDLLGNPQDHLEKICGPPGKEPSRTAWTRNHHRDLCIVARIDRTQVKVEIPVHHKRLPAKWMDVDS